jgi:thioredoxin-related protein
MKLTLTLISFCLYVIAFGQSRFQQIEDLDTSSIPLKVIMLSADWCNICAVNETKIERKRFLKDFDLSQVEFYKLSENHPSPIIFNDTVYHFEKTGINEGRHQLIDQLFKGATISYPTFLFLDQNNQLMESRSGFIDESEIESILYGILNQTDVPDSVKSI